MYAADDIFSRYARAYEGRKDVEMTLLEYLDGCRADPMLYASAAERMIAAIGEAEIIDTAKDARLSRVFMNRPELPAPSPRMVFPSTPTNSKSIGIAKPPHTTSPSTS